MTIDPYALRSPSLQHPPLLSFSHAKCKITPSFPSPSPSPLFPLPTSIPVLLPPKTASLRQPRFPARRLAQHGRAPAADDDGLGVGEDGRDGEAARALDVHEEGAGGGDEHLWGERVSRGDSFWRGEGGRRRRGGLLGRERANR